MTVTPVPPCDPGDDETRLIRAILGACPECDAAGPHQHEDAEPLPEPVCSRFKMPAAFRDGQWQHAEAADRAVCALFFWAAG